MKGVEAEGFVRERTCGAVLGSKEAKAMVEVEIIIISQLSNQHGNGIYRFPTLSHTLSLQY